MAHSYVERFNESYLEHVLTFVSAPTALTLAYLDGIGSYGPILQEALDELSPF